MKKSAPLWAHTNNYLYISHMFQEVNFNILSLKKCCTTLFANITLLPNMFSGSVLHNLTLAWNYFFFHMPSSIFGHKKNNTFVGYGMYWNVAASLHYEEILLNKGYRDHWIQSETSNYLFSKCLQRINVH